MVEKKATGTVLVAGAGVAGIKAAIELAESGYKVLLTDASSHTGGILSKLDYQFPSDHCGMCRMLPMVGREYSSEYCMRKDLYHENIEIIPFSEVTKVDGEAGNFTVELVRKAQYVNTDMCNGMGKCIDVCPVEVADEFNHGLTTRKAIYQPVPHNTPNMLMIDRDACTDCGACVEICEKGAINFAAEDESECRQVNSVILASGSSLYDIEEAEDAKSYNTSPDVVTSLAFERMLSSSGSYQNGQILRPSDGKPAKKIAWIQCMGSRNKRQGRPYCSSICCMFALKEAVLAKEKGGEDIESTIFYMDMRTFGKGFYAYQDKAVNENGVELIRCRVQEVVKLPHGQLEIRYYDSQKNEFFTKEYDIVVMSTGQSPFEDHKKWSAITGAPLNDLGILAMDNESKIRIAEKPGLFMCGSLMGLTDISEAMASGMAAAGETVRFMQSLSLEQVESRIVPEPVIETGGIPKVAVVLCKCSHKPGEDGIDYALLEKILAQHNGVEIVKIIDSFCAGAKNENLASLSNSACNRLVVGVCQPFLYRPAVWNICKEAGFHSSLTKLYDLRSLIRRGIAGPSMEEWTKKIAADLCSEVETLKLTPMLSSTTMTMNQSALIVGGGVTGMHTALSLADRGVDVHMVERKEQLGGLVGTTVLNTIDGLMPVESAKAMKLRVETHKNISLYLGANIEKSHGSFGAFETKVQFAETAENAWIHHGAVVLATGGNEGETAEFSRGDCDRVLTQSELRDGLVANSLALDDAEDVVMIQCAGSREKGKRNYCSRICCMWAITNAINLKKKNPDTRVIVLYRDMMTYGFNELYYTEARKAGVLFVSYDLDSAPQVEIVEGRPQVSFTESVLNEPLVLSTDYVILSTGVEPAEGTSDMAKIFGLPLTEDGFFEEVDSKWRPIEFQKMGVFVAGVAHSPQPLKDCLMQAEAAAQKTFSFLQKSEMETARKVSTVRDSLCVRCQLCISACPFEARVYDAVNHSIEVDSAACQGCGMCSVTCRNNATQVAGWNDKQLMAMMDQKLMDELTFL